MTRATGICFTGVETVTDGARSTFAAEASGSRRTDLDVRLSDLGNQEVELRVLTSDPKVSLTAYPSFVVEPELTLERGAVLDFGVVQAAVLRPCRMVVAAQGDQRLAGDALSPVGTPISPAPESWVEVQDGNLIVVVELKGVAPSFPKGNFAGAFRLTVEPPHLDTVEFACSGSIR